MQSIAFSHHVNRGANGLKPFLGGGVNPVSPQVNRQTTLSIKPLSAQVQKVFCFFIIGLGHGPLNLGIWRRIQKYVGYVGHVGYVGQETGDLGILALQLHLPLIG